MLRSIPRRGKSRRGGVLICALAFVVITSFILAGIGTFAVSHLSRVGTESDYSAALNLAEAGINYELRNISSDITNANLPHQLHPSAGMNGAYTGSISGASGSFTVSVTNDPDNGQAWRAPANLLLTATGTINGVTRTVRCRGARRSIFDDYSFFGIDSTTMNGSWIGDGNFGTDSPITVSGGSSEIYGSVTFDGTSGSYPASQTTGGVWYEPDKIKWPTVSTMADNVASQLAGVKVTTGTGLIYLKLHNNNAQIMQFSATDATLTNPTQHSWTASGLTADANGNWVISDGAGSKTFNGITTDTNSMDQTTSTTPRYVFPATTYSFTNPTSSVTLSTYSPYNGQVLILPGSPTSTPYNYYLDLLDLKGNGGKKAVLIDNATGPVNIWIGNSSVQYGSTADTLNGTFFFTSYSNSTNFRLYDAKSATLTMTGNSVFPGGIYDYNGTGVGTVSLQGSAAIIGSIIGDNMSLGGGPFIYYPSNMNNSNDYGLWYGFLNQWTEVNGM